jgi:hypothetical protein
MTAIWAKQGNDALEIYYNKNILNMTTLKMNEEIQGIVIFRLNEGHEKATLENFQIKVPFKNSHNEDVYSLNAKGLYGDVIVVQNERSSTKKTQAISNQGDLEAKINTLRSLLQKGLISQEEFNAVINNMLESKD